MTRVTSSGLRRALTSTLGAAAIWLAYVAVTVLHVYLRGEADDLGRAPYSPAALEHSIFNGIPTLWLQHRVPADIPLIKWFAVLLHASWFYGPLLLAILVWARCGKQALARLLAVHVALLFSADAIYALFPTRPPWMDFDLIRVVNLAYGGATSVDSNTVAAVPSLHVAVPALYALWLSRQHDSLLRRLSPVLALWTVGIAWSVVYGGEHYVIDVAAGILWSGLVYLLVELMVTAPVWTKIRELLQGRMPAGRRRAPVASTSYRTTVEGIGIDE